MSKVGRDLYEVGVEFPTGWLVVEVVVGLIKPRLGDDAFEKDS